MSDVRNKSERFELRVSTDEKELWTHHARHLKLAEFVRLTMNKVCEELDRPGRDRKKLEREELVRASFPGSSTEVVPGDVNMRPAPRKGSRGRSEPFCEHRRRRDEFCPRCDG